jgi:membrane protein
LIWPGFVDYYRSVDWTRVSRRVVSEIRRDDVFGRAAELSYFLVFSLVPSLLIMTVVLGYLARGEELRSALLGYLGQLAPGPGFSLIRDILADISEKPGGGKLSIGIVTTLWAASSGMSSIIQGLNKAYEVREARPWWKRRIVAAAMTISLSLLTVTSLLILVYGELLGGALADWFGFGPGFRWFWEIARWPSVVGFVFTAFLIVYRFGPNLRGQKWRWILPGAFCALLIWLVVSFGLRLYLRWFPAYGVVYGSMGAVLVLLLWLYLSSAAVLIGGELNAEIENSAAAHGAPDAKRAGEKAPELSRR